MQFISDNWQTIALFVTTTIAVASHMAALTPSTKDDAAVSMLGKLFQIIAGNYGHAKNSK